MAPADGAFIKSTVSEALAVYAQNCTLQGHYARICFSFGSELHTAHLWHKCSLPPSRDEAACASVAPPSYPARDNGAHSVPHLISKPSGADMFIASVQVQVVASWFCTKAKLLVAGDEL